MATLNVRLEDHVRDQLKAQADAEGKTLSEHVRDLLMEAVVPVYDADEKHGDEPAPDSLRTSERQVLSLLHRILARVLPEGANDVDGDREYQLERAEVLENGFVGEYWMEVAGFSTELSRRDCNRVNDILQMFRITTFSIEHLQEQGASIDEGLKRSLEFQGFDHNDPLEAQMARYVAYQMRDGDRWSELKPQIEMHDQGNSHSKMLATYSRMLNEYRRIMDSRQRGHSRHDYLLTLDELRLIADSRWHPSHRPGSE